MSSVSSLERIFFECLQQGSREERLAYLEQACAGDAGMLRSLQKMLEAHDSSFLEQPACVPESSAEQAGQRIGAYRLVEPIGEGGMGTVWRAEQLEPVRREVAVKLIKAGMDSRQVIARFEAERQALALMEHPNIARVLDGGADAAGRPYFVMDLFAGVPITRFCDERRLSLRARLELFAQVCEAIQHAHQKGVIHRDIKPSNVLVALQDGRAVPKVIDFGIAKAIEQGPGGPTAFTQQGGFVGTLEYMSPEQSTRSAGGVDTRSDIYSLGVLLYELLTGGTPLSRQLLEESSLADILRVIADGETPKPSTRLRETGAARVSGELDWIAMRALEKDRDRRYATAADLGQDVRRFLADEPVQAGPPSATYRLRKFARRNRGALTAAGVLVVGLLVAIGGVGWTLRDRAARGARVSASVGDLLAAAEREMSAQAWSAALATVRRADAVLANGEAEPATAQSVRALLADLELVERLESVRSEQTMWAASGFDSAAAVRGYASVFAASGLDVEGASVESLIERLERTPALAFPLAAGLDDLARRKLEATRVSADGLRFVRVADAIDPDPVRSGIRNAGAVLDTAELERIAGSLDVPRQHPVTIVNLVRALRPVKPATTTRLLREAQGAHPGDFWIAFELARSLRDEHDLEGALRFDTVAVAIRPDSAAAHSNLAHTLLQLHDVDAGIASIRRAIELAPGIAMPHGNMCRALLELHKPEEALKEIRTALELDPRSAVCWTGLGMTLLELDRLEEASEAYVRALELDPKNCVALSGDSDVLRARGKLPEAIARAREAIAADPAQAGAHISLGNALAESGESAAAGAAFRKALELEPKNTVALCNLGNTLGGSENPAVRAEAIALGRKCVELDPTYALGHYGLGNSLLEDGQLDAALASWRRALELHPSFYRAYFMIGQVERNRRRYDEALAAFRRVVELHPNHDGAWAGIALVHLARNELADAESALRKSVEINPAVADVYHALAVVLGAQGRREDALAARRRAAEIEPGVAMRHVAVATDLFELQRFDDAAEACRKAIEVDPGCQIAHKLLGVFLRLQWKYGEAIEPLEEALRLDPKDAGVAGILAMLLVTCPELELRNPPRALELARKAIELEPGDPSNTRTLGVALYRTGSWQEALEALNEVSKRSPDNTGFDLFFISMAQQQLGNLAEAQAAYKQGCEKFERANSEDPDTRRARDEAAQLLGIESSPR